MGREQGPVLKGRRDGFSRSIWLALPAFRREGGSVDRRQIALESTATSGGIQPKMSKNLCAERPGNSQLLENARLETLASAERQTPLLIKADN